MVFRRSIDPHLEPMQVLWSWPSTTWTSMDFWLFTVGRVADSAAPGFVLIVFISSFRSDLPSNHS